jgi:hypothetical protein
VYLDCDGVFRAGYHSTGPHIDRSLIDAIANLDADLYWLTMRGESVHQHVDFGLDATVIATPTEWLESTWLADNGSWWKLQVMQRRAADGRPFVWIDDHLHRVRAAWDWSASLIDLSRWHLFVAPSSSAGLEDRQVTGSSTSSRCATLQNATLGGSPHRTVADPSAFVDRPKELISGRRCLAAAVGLLAVDTEDAHGRLATGGRHFWFRICRDVHNRATQSAFVPVTPPHLEVPPVGHAALCGDRTANDASVRTTRLHRLRKRSRGQAHAVYSRRSE